jgi:hypothetical protein
MRREYVKCAAEEETIRHTYIVERNEEDIERFWLNGHENVSKGQGE